MRVPSGAAPAGCLAKAVTSDSFTPKTASESMYSLPAANRCVVMGWCPGAETIMWMCPGRIGWRPIFLSITPTGPSVGTG